MNPINTLQELLISRKPNPWAFPSYASVSAAGTTNWWQADATLEVPGLSQPLTATAFGTSKQRAKFAAAESLLEQLQQHGYSTTGPDSGPNPYKKELEALLTYDQLGIHVSALYSDPIRVGGDDHIPEWETEVTLSVLLGLRSVQVISKVARSGSKLAAQEAAAKALLEDPALYELLGGFRRRCVDGANGNAVSELMGFREIEAAPRSIHALLSSR